MTVESNYVIAIPMIGLKDSRQFFNQREAKPKLIAPCTRDFSRASGELQLFARNCDWFMELFVPVVIGRSICFGFVFRQSIENRSKTVKPVIVLPLCSFISSCAHVRRM